MTPRNKLLLAFGVAALVIVGILLIRAYKPKEKNEYSDSSKGANQQEFTIATSSDISGVRPEQQTKMPASQENEVTFRFVGKVLAIENQINGEISRVSQQPHQPYASNGLYNGYKGDVIIANRSCSLIIGGIYSFRVSYKISTGQYVCENASLTHE